MEIYDLIDMNELEELTKKCDLLITHGGVGSILCGLTNNKKVIAAARLSKYKEHTNDHQKQIIKEFVDRGYLLELSDFNKLDELLKKIDTFKPNKYKSNNKNFVKLVDSYIEKDNHISWYNKYRYLASYGYLGIIMSLVNLFSFSIFNNMMNIYLNILCSFIITLVFNILFNYLCDVSIKDNICRYLVIKTSSLIIDFLCIYTIFNLININIIGAKAISNVIILIVSYIIIKYIFRKEEV